MLPKTARVPELGAVAHRRADIQHRALADERVVAERDGRDLDDAREHYMKEAKAVVSDVVDSARRAAQAFADTFKKK